MGMPTKDIILTIIIIFSFTSLISTSLLGIHMQDMQDNIVKYRCNPVVMPFMVYLVRILAKILHNVCKICKKVLWGNCFNLLIIH